MDERDLLIGKLVQGQETLNKNVEALFSRLVGIEAAVNRGKGFATGVLALAGTAGGVVGYLIHTLLRHLK